MKEEVTKRTIFLPLFLPTLHAPGLWKTGAKCGIHFQSLRTPYLLFRPPGKKHHFKKCLSLLAWMTQKKSKRPFCCKIFHRFALIYINLQAFFIRNYPPPLLFRPFSVNSFILGILSYFGVLLFSAITLHGRGLKGYFWIKDYNCIGYGPLNLESPMQSGCDEQIWRRKNGSSLPSLQWTPQSPAAWPYVCGKSLWKDWDIFTVTFTANPRFCLLPHFLIWKI